jgi:DNA polymerase III sliding clamp (beta) subunit (PCNA family)
MNLNRKKFLDDLQVIEKLLATSHIDKDIFWMKRKENNLFLVAFGGVGYLELSMSPYAEIEGEENFQCALKLSQISHFIKNLKNEEVEMQIDMNENRILFLGPGKKKSEWYFQLINRFAPDRPYAYDDSKEFMPIELYDITNGIEKTKFSIDKNQSHAPRTSVYLKISPKGIIIYTTDGIRISRYKIRKDCQLSQDLFIPSFALEIVNRLFAIGGNDAQILIDKNYFSLKSPDNKYFYFAPQENGNSTYPDVAKFFRKTNLFNVKISRSELWDNIILSQAADELIKIRMVFSDNLYLSAKTHSINFETSVKIAEPLEKPIELQINSKLLTDVLSNGIKNEEFNIGISETPTQSQIKMLYLQDDMYDHLIAQTE